MRFPFLSPFIFALALALLTLWSGRDENSRAIAGVTLPLPIFSSDVYLDAVNFPTNLTFAPDGRMFYNERCGKVRVVEADGDLLLTPFIDITADAICYADYGLVGLELDPSYSTNHFVYILYMEEVSTNPLVAKAWVKRYTDVNNIGTNPTTIIGDFPNVGGSANPLNMHGANNIHFGPDGKLYISMGEDNQKLKAQDVSSPLGKLLRVNKEDGSAPSDNPFYNTPGAYQRVFAYGFRNSYDFDWHPDNDGLYMTENGYNACDELNKVVGGGNYGWPYGFEADNDPYPLGNTCEAGGDPAAPPGATFTEAIYYFRFFEWMQGYNINSTSAPVGILAIDDEDYPSLGDSFLVCEYRNSTLRLLMMGGAGLDQVIDEPRVLRGDAEFGCRVDVERSPSGDIYYTTLSQIRRLIIDSDGDTLEDKLDNCPGWANGAQGLPPWPVPEGDFDCDGYSDGVERAVGTDVIAACPVDALHDAWPPDIDKSTFVSITDVLSLKPHLGQSVPPAPPRYDLAPSGAINISDVLEFKKTFGQDCTP